jgi:hypothetical protein
MTNNSTKSPLSEDEIITILIAANEIIMYGGKGLLGKILAGSKDKRIYTANLHHSPAYGAFEGMTQKQIMEKVEWVLSNGYLSTDEKLSLITYTEKGWDIAKEALAEDFYTELVLAAEFERYDYLEVIRNQSPDLRMLILDVIEEQGDTDLIEMLMAWLDIEVDKPLPERIHEVIQKLDKSNARSGAIDDSFEANKKWLALPADIRQMFIRNVFCGKCLDAVQIEKYIIKNHRDTIVLEGRCKTCGHKVARVID